MPALLPAILAMKCPCCRKGAMFTNNSILPLSRMLDMPERCPVCGQKMELEPGFFYGTGYVSYGLSVGLLGLYSIAFGLTAGFSYKDNSVYWFLGTGISGLALLQPWLMRMSRVLYLYLFVASGSGGRGDEDAMLEPFCVILTSTSAIAAQTPGLPLQTPGLPLLTPGLPLQTPGFPLLTPGFPLLTPAFPLLTPGVPLLTPGFPHKHPASRIAGSPV